jgi:hypothetical protein
LIAASSSGDLNTFTNSASVPAATGFFVGLASSGTTAMAISLTGTIVATTSDGATWTSATAMPAFSPNTANLTWAGLAYGGGKWVAVAGGANAPSTQVAYSTNNGTSWTSINPLTSAYWNFIKYANGYFLAIAANPSYSTDGITWSTGTGSPSSSIWQTFYAAGSLNAWYSISPGTGTFSITSSTNNGATWTSATTPTATGIVSYNRIYCVWGNGKVVAIQQTSSTSWTSTDAVTWTANTSAFSSSSTSTYWDSITFTNGYFIAVASAISSFTYAVWYSTDGISWAQSTTVGSNKINKFVALA